MSQGTTGAEILLVEDNPNDVELILHVFQWCNLGDRVHVAWNGEEALDYLFGTGPYEGKSAGRPKVILLDLKLPKVDGIEVLRKIKKEPSTHAIPVVIFTSSREERDIIESLCPRREQLYREARAVRSVCQCDQRSRAVLAGDKPATG